MPQNIKPFKGTHYNPLKINNFNNVVCPPYDVINNSELKSLRKKSAFNFSHVLLADKSNYQSKRKTLDSWVAKKVLVDDLNECLYLYEQKYRVNGKKITRYGIISLLRMNKKGIFPHERTHKAPKEDRKKIIKALEANLSPIFVIASSKVSALTKAYKHYSKRKPFVCCDDKDKNLNRIWKVEDKKYLNSLCKEFNNSKLLIADGHHRFEISYDYFNKHKSKFKDLNYLMAYITDCQKGLLILPTHRILTIKDSEAELFKKLSKYFSIKLISKKLLASKLTKAKTFTLGLYRAGKLFCLELKDKDILLKISNKYYRKIDAYVFHSLVLSLFKVDKPIEYTHSIDEAIELSGNKKTAFLLGAANLDSVIDISSKGFKLPQKSTYFYPKLLSGLVIRRFSK